MTGQQLKEARLRLGLTQKQLAATLELSTNAIAMMERDERPIMKITVLAIAHLSCMSKAKGRH